MVQTIMIGKKLQIVDALRKSQATILGGASAFEFLTGKEIKEEEKTVEDTQKEFGSNMTINKDGSYTSSRLISLNASELKDPDSILKAHGFDPEKWEIVSAKNNLRETGKHSLYASYLTVKPRDENGWSLERIEKLFDKLKREYTASEKEGLGSRIECNGNLVNNGHKMLLINIADLHMNLQSTMLSAGNEYNCEIAEALFFGVINDVLKRTNLYDFEKIVFCIGGDMMNGDNMSGSTTKGTPQDSDTHYYDAYEKLCEMTIKAIDILKDYAKVEVIYVPGNHDELTGFKLAKFIDAWFRNDDDVAVDYSPLPRKYTVYGKTLFCFAHDGNAKTLPSLIADEARRYWSQVDTTEVFLQHLHSEQILMEDNNIRIQRLPTISGKSKWSNDNGFNSKRQCKSFVFDKEFGLTDVIYTTLRQYEKKVSNVADKRMQKAKRTIRCPYCGEDKYEDNFYNTNSQFYPSGKLPYCKSCMKEVYDKYHRIYELKKDPHAEESALKRLCAVCDIYYSSRIYNASIKEMEKSQGWDIIAAFFKNRNLPQYNKKDFGNTISEMESEISARAIDDYIAEHNAKDLELSDIPKETIARFGKGFSAEDYEFLQEQYADWIARHECKTKAQEEIFKNICFNRLLYHKAVVAGEETKALSDEFNKLLDSGKLQPKQNSADAMSDVHVWGTIVRKIEETRPTAEIAPELQDVDGLGRYVDAWMRGHTCKMVGVQNTYSDLYDSEMEKYTVHKPQYDEDDESSALYGSIFGETKKDGE